MSGPRGGAGNGRPEQRWWAGVAGEGPTAVWHPEEHAAAPETILADDPSRHASAAADWLILHQRICFNAVCVKKLPSGPQSSDSWFISVRRAEFGLYFSLSHPAAAVGKVPFSENTIHL